MGQSRFVPELLQRAGHDFRPRADSELKFAAARYAWPQHDVGSTTVLVHLVLEGLQNLTLIWVVQIPFQASQR